MPVAKSLRQVFKSIGTFKPTRFHHLANVVIIEHAFSRHNLVHTMHAPSDSDPLYDVVDLFFPSSSSSEETDESSADESELKHPEIVAAPNRLSSLGMYILDELSRGAMHV